MIGRSVVVLNRSGLHARLASLFCAKARQFDATVLILARDQLISARSILDVMAANIQQGEEIALFCDGPQEEAVSSALVTFIQSLRE